MADNFYATSARSVISLDGLSGSLTLVAGPGVSISDNSSNGTITISSGGAASAISQLTGDVSATGPGSVPATVNLVGGAAAADVASATALTLAATSLDTLNAIVKRDGSGNFAAGTITAALTGNVTGNVSGSAATFTTALSGDVTGNQSSTAIAASTVTGKALTGYVIGSNTPIGATDSILQAFEKLQGQVSTTSGAAITALTGDGTATGPGSVALTLATVNANVGAFGSSTAIPTLTVNAKGLVTAASTNAVIAPAGTLTGATLAANVLASSLTSVGTIATGVWQGTPVATQYGGLGASFAASTGALSISSGTVSAGVLSIANGGTGAATTSQNFAFIGPTSGAGAPSYRALVAGDIPSLPYASSTLTSTHIFVGNVSNVAADVAVSGDATLANNGALTLATVNSNVGSFGSSTAIPSFTVNGKGLITAASTSAVVAPAGTLTGTTLASGVVTSSLTTVGTIGTGVWNGTTVDTGHGGTGVTSVTIAPTASAFAGWDSHSNLSANSFLAGYATTATGGATTTLTVSSAELQYFTGSTTQTVVLPVTSTLVLGQQYTIVNNSSGVVTVQSSGANTVQAMAANSRLVVAVVSTGLNTAAAWDAAYSINNGAANAITALTGDATASGPGSAALTLATVNTNTGAWGDATHVAAITVNGKGLVTAAASTAIQIAESQVTNLVSDLAGKQATGNYLTALTSDVTASGPGSAAATIAANAVTNGKFRQSAALSVVGNGTNATANVADITGTANQVLVVNSGGTALAFGQVSLTAGVTGVLPAANGGTNNTASAKTGNYTIASTDSVILLDSSGGVFNLTLPSPSTVTGQRFFVVDKTGSLATNNVTLVRNGSEKIMGLTASKLLQTAWGFYIIISDGTDWYLS